VSVLDRPENMSRQRLEFMANWNSSLAQMFAQGNEVSTARLFDELTYQYTWELRRRRAQEAQLPENGRKAPF
jgi:hypothetical protein